ncbi:MAG TPA: sulfite exporter TauE/SafE family protein [Candidatus Eisenbacteria bacterium]|jgi:hypothetical protein
MTPGGRFRALLAGVAAGIAGGLFGVGGGLVLIPVLTAWFGATQHQAHGTSLAVIGATALASIVVYGAFSNVSWGTALAVGVSSAFAARLGARAAARTSSRALTMSFAVFLLLVAVRLLWKAPEALGPPIRSPGAALALDLGLGLAVGMLAGYMGVGGGILAVPAFTLLLGMPQQMGQGTSLAVILFTAPAGAIEHTRHGNVLWRLVPALAAGAAVGAVAASWWVQRIPHALLARAFAIFLLANSVATFARARRVRAPAAPAA